MKCRMRTIWKRRLTSQIAFETETGNFDSRPMADSSLLIAIRMTRRLRRMNRENLMAKASNVDGRMIPDMRKRNQTGGKRLTENEKKLMQAKHRLEEAQMRDRVRERKARTRRLIQEGAILEKVLPGVTNVELDELEEFLRPKLCG